MSDARAQVRPRRRPWTLRFRVTTAFALGSLAIVGILGIVTYEVAQHYLVEQRERSLLRRTFIDARVLRDEIQRGQRPKAAVGLVDLGARSRIALRIDGRWHQTSESLGVGAAGVPRGMRRLVESGAAGRQWTRTDGVPTLVVGLPVPAIDAQYYETFVLNELDRTMGVLRTALIGGGTLAVVFGGLLGWWMSGRILRPVRKVAVAAERVAGGDLHTRIAEERDADLRSLVTSFNHMVDAVETRIDRETRFVADVAHELRSPLTTVTTAAQVMATRRDELSPAAAEALDHLEAEVQRLQQLVDDLLELGRADAGVADLRPESVDVGELVRQGLRDERGDVEIVVPAEGVRARVDKRRLARALQNLVANADAHGDGLRRVAVERRGDVARIEVEDAGPGVDPADRSAVFDRFYRGAAAGRRGTTPGAGLGLALVAEHVQLLGGRVWVEDGTDGGARFVIELPTEEA
jgi:two-component system, OmpR family, sensor histidine kinase MtrB